MHFVYYTLIQQKTQVVLTMIEYWNRTTKPRIINADTKYLQNYYLKNNSFNERIF